MIKKINWPIFMIMLIFPLPAISLVDNPSSSKVIEKRVYMAEEEPARAVLEKLLAIFGKRLIGDAVPNAPLSGRFEVKSPEEVMNYFSASFQINWFKNGTRVYVYRSGDWATKRIYTGGDRSNEEWKEFINASGLHYSQFPYVFIPDSKELVVSGPTAYTNLVSSAFSVPRPDPSEIEKHGVGLMVFQLKYASVEDRATNLRGTRVTTPGALAVLLNLLNLPQQRVSSSTDLKKPGFNVEKGADRQYGYSSSGERFATMPASQTEGVNRAATSKPVADLENLPSITADIRTNSILIRDAKSKYDYYKELIDRLDRPMAMIEVEAMMVEVDDSALSDFGVEFGLLTRNLNYEFPGVESTGRSVFRSANQSGGTLYPDGYLPGANSIVDPTRFMLRLRALAADQNAKVLARPTILTQDNISAYIDLSETVYLPLTGERVAEVAPITAGSLLQVTPRMIDSLGGTQVFLQVEIQDGALVESIVTSGGSGPRIQNTTLNTQAILEGNKAILIGGYKRESTESRVAKVPLLGDLPFVGKAFQTNEKTSRKVARLFLITPRVVQGAIQDTQTNRSAVEQLSKRFDLKGSEYEPTPTLRIDSTLSR